MAGVYGATFSGPIATLTGAELVTVDNGGATLIQTTTAAIARLGATGVQSAIVALNTVGNGVVSAAAISTRIVARGGAQANAAFTDTTATAAAILAALPALQIGSSFEFTYQNNTNANATLNGGAGVTVSGGNVIPSGAVARYLVTYTAANTLTMQLILQTDPTTADGTFVANGATAVVVADTRVTANSVIAYGLKTVGGTPAAKPYESAITPGIGFSVKAAAGDTSTYNYQIIG